MPAAPVAESSAGTSTAFAATRTYTAGDGMGSSPPETSSAAREVSGERAAVHECLIKNHPHPPQSRKQDSRVQLLG